MAGWANLGDRLHPLNEEVFPGEYPIFQDGPNDQLNIHISKHMVLQHHIYSLFLDGNDQLLGVNPAPLAIQHQNESF